MLKKLATLALLAVLLMASCKSFSEEGRSLNQARRARNDQDYVQSINLAIKAVQLDPEYYEAMSFLSGAFKEGTNHFNGIIDQMKPNADSIEQIKGDVVLPVDYIYFSFIALDKMSRAVQSAGLERMYDADEDKVYLCEIDHFEIELGEWKPKAMETHYIAINEFLSRNHPMEAKQAHKHARYLRTNYDSEYKDSAELEAQALEEAQIILSVAVRKNSHEEWSLMRDQLVIETSAAIQSNPEIMTYATFNHSEDLVNQVWNASEASTEELGQWAAEEGIDYVVVLDMKTNQAEYSLRDFTKRSQLTEDFTTLNGMGEMITVSSTIDLVNVQRLMQASVSGYGRLLESATGSYYYNTEKQALGSEKSQEYNEVTPDTVNAFFNAPPVSSILSVIADASLKDMLYQNYTSGMDNKFLFLKVENTLPYYTDDGVEGMIYEMSPSEIYTNYIGATKDTYNNYLTEVRESFDAQNSQGVIMSSLWEDLAQNCYTGLVDILD